MTLLDEIRAKCSPTLLASQDTQAIADAVNVGRVRVGKLASHDIRQYLMLVDLLLPIEASDAPSCKAATRALEVFPIFDMADPMVYAKFSQVLDGLVAETIIPDFTETHKATILGMASQPDPVSEFDVRLACWSDAGEWIA